MPFEQKALMLTLIENHYTPTFSVVLNYKWYSRNPSAIGVCPETRPHQARHRGSSQESESMSEALIAMFESKPF